MMNKKGFTLIEAIVSIALIALVSTILVVSITNLRKKQNEKDWKKLVDRVETAAEAYLEFNSEIKTTVYSGTTQYVLIEELVNEGLLDENYLIDPRDNILVTKKSSIQFQRAQIKTNANGALEIVYPSLEQGTVLVINTNGGTININTRQVLATGSTIDVPNPTKSGYTFVNWTVRGTGSVINGTTFTMGSTDAVLTANWNVDVASSEPNEDTLFLVINANGGSWTGTNPQSLASGEKVSIGEPVKSNFTFAYWTVSGEGSSFNEETNEFTMGASDAVLTANWLLLEKEFAYIEPVDETDSPYHVYSVPATGWYEIEVWGAQGGDAGGYRGGFGGYSTGVIYLTAEAILYINVGGKPTNTAGGFNGGGNGRSESTSRYGRGGGGGTDIRGGANTLANRIIIAGGGGGGGTGDYNVIGGTGGGISGGVGSGYDVGGGAGSLGQGGAVTGCWGGGGGGGYYGGSGGACAASGGGGSGFINNLNLENKAMYCYGCIEDLDNEGTFTISTIGESNLKDTINCPNGYSLDPISKCAKAGNGHARITYIGS